VRESKLLHPLAHADKVAACRVEPLEDGGRFFFGELHAPQRIAEGSRAEARKQAGRRCQVAGSELFPTDL